LGRVVDFFAGGSLPEGQPYEGQDGGYFLMKVSDMNLPGNRTVILRSKEWSKSPGARSATCPAGAVVIPKRGGAIGTNKKRLITRPAVLDPNLMAVWPHPDKVDLKFLYQWFLAFDLASIASGSSVPQLNKRDLAPLPFPLPPIEEQRRVADVLDRADGLRAKRREALAHLDGLTQSIFLEVFDEPATNRRGMELRTLGELVKLKSGSFLPASRMAKNGQHAVLGGNGISGYHDEYMFEEPKLVVGRVGAYCGCVHMSPPQSWVTDNALYVSELDPSVTITYLAHALERASLNQYASQSGQPLISGSRVYPTPVLVPPIPLQRQFADRVNAVEMLKAKNQTSLAELDSLFASLQDRSFRGLL
jgi:type I restriction enzyme S subunit